MTVKVVDSVFQKYIPHKYKPQPNKEKPKHQIDFDKVTNLPFIRGFFRKSEERNAKGRNHSGFLVKERLLKKLYAASNQK